MSFKNFFLMMLLILSSCVRDNCALSKIKTIYIDTNQRIGSSRWYGHYVLLEGFSRNCLDSSTIVNITKRYIDTVKNGKPIDVIKFYNSDKKFVPDAIPSFPDLEQDCLLVIGFNKKGESKTFIFYNSNGEISFIGNKWIKGNNR